MDGRSVGRANPVGRLFDAVSRVYDTRAVQALAYRPAQDAVVSELRSAGVRRVLDVGCGTGILAARLGAELGAEVVCGCDLSAGMLQQAAARSSEVGWMRGDAARLPLRDAAVDAVVSTEAFHFFDQRAALAEFHRVLVPGGRVLIAFINPRTELGSRAMGGQARALGTASWPTQREMRRRVEAAGFVVRSQRRVNRVLGRVIPTVLTIGIRPA